MREALVVKGLRPGQNLRKRFMSSKLLSILPSFKVSTSLLLLFSANQWTGFFMIGTSVMKELRLF